MSALSERKITDIIFYEKVPADVLLNIKSSPELSPLSKTIDESIQKFEKKEISVEGMYPLIKAEFDKYIKENPSVIDRDFTFITQRFPINNLVRPSSCKLSLVGFVYYDNQLYIPILFLVVLLFMKHKGIPEKEFFKKESWFSNVRLLDHLEKKENEWLFRKENEAENCSDLFRQLINVYNFVYSNTDEPPVNPGLTLLAPKIGGRRSRYRKSKRKARKTRRS